MKKNTKTIKAALNRAETRARKGLGLGDVYPGIADQIAEENLRRMAAEGRKVRVWVATKGSAKTAAAYAAMLRRTGSVGVKVRRESTRVFHVTELATSTN